MTSITLEPRRAEPGVLVIVALPLAWALAQSRVTRPTRLGLGVAVGLLAIGFGVVSHGLHIVNSGLDWRDVTGVGGGEVVLEAAAHDRRLAAVVSDGAARPVDGNEANHAEASQRAITWLQMQMVRGVSGMRSSRSLLGMIPGIAPRPVLLIAGGGLPEEIPASRRYRDAGGRSVQLWELADTGHTAGLRKHPAEYERRTIGFLDAALGSG